MSAREAAAHRRASRRPFSRSWLRLQSLLLTAVTVLALLALVTSCSLIPGTAGHDASRTPASMSPSRATSIVGTGGGVTVTIPAGAVPADTTVTVSQQPLTGFNPPAGVVALTALTTVAVAAEPTTAATVTFPAPASLSATLRPMVLWQDGHGGWRAVPTTWSPGAAQVVASVDHFSGGFLAAIDVQKTAEAATARIRGYLTGRAGVAQPSCGDETGARSRGVRVTSNGGDSVKWCFGRENGQTVVKVANNRRTFTEITYPQTWAVKDGSTRSFSTDTVARALGTAVAGTPGVKARIVDGGDTLTLVLPSDRPGRPEEIHARISSEAWLVQALFFGLDVYGTVVKTTYTALGKGAASIGPRVLAVFSGSADDDVYEALRACGKAAGDLTNGPVTAGVTTALLKFGLACAPKVGEAVLLSTGGLLVSIVVGAIASVVSLVLTAVNLLVSGLRELYDDLASLGGASTPDYTILIAPALAVPPASTITYRRYTNPRFGFSFDVPASWVEGDEAANGDGRGFTSLDGLAGIQGSGSHNIGLDCYKQPPPGSTLATCSLAEVRDGVTSEIAASGDTTITYQAQGTNWFVLSGTDRGGQIWYSRYTVGDGDIDRLDIGYPVSRKAQMDPVVSRVVSSYQAGDVANGH